MNKTELETKRRDVIDKLNCELSKMNNPQTIKEKEASLGIGFQLLEELKNIDEQLTEV